MEKASWSEKKKLNNKKVSSYINVDDFEDKYSPASDLWLIKLSKMIMLSHENKVIKYTQSLRWPITNLYETCS